VDASGLTRLHTPAVRARVESLDAGGLARCSMTDLEVGFSARSGAAWHELTTALEAFALVEIDAGHFARARQVQRLLADRGLKGRKVPDLLIAAAAEASGRTVLHYDADFDHIATVTGQATEWVVPRGSIS